MEYHKILVALDAHFDEEHKIVLQRFFQTGKGGYGEGDVFWGIRVPTIRKVAKNFKDVSKEVLQECMESGVHEVRFFALVVMMDQINDSLKKVELSGCGIKNKKEKIRLLELEKNKDRQNLAEKYFNFYFKNIEFINNWDLVDISCRSLVGDYLLKYKSWEFTEDFLLGLVKSDYLWTRRTAIVATWAFIRVKEIDVTLKIAKVLLKDSHDLIHKAIGWMLREAWKSSDKNAEKVEDFLIENYADLSRNTLRYAIEKMEEGRRKEFLKGEF